MCLAGRASSAQEVHPQQVAGALLVTLQELRERGRGSSEGEKLELLHHLGLRPGTGRHREYGPIWRLSLGMGVEHDRLPCAQSYPYRLLSPYAALPGRRRESVAMARMFSRPSTQRGNSTATPAESGIGAFARSVWSCRAGRRGLLVARIRWRRRSASPAARVGTVPGILQPPGTGLDPWLASLRSVTELRPPNGASHAWDRRRSATLRTSAANLGKSASTWSNSSRPNAYRLQ